MEDLKTLKACGEILFFHCSLKHHLTETHEQNVEIHNIVLFSKSISSTGKGHKWIKGVQNERS